jgi:hypothetical protein
MIHREIEELQCLGFTLSVGGYSPSQKDIDIYGLATIKGWEFFGELGTLAAYKQGYTLSRPILCGECWDDVMSDVKKALSRSNRKRVTGKQLSLFD